MSIQRKKGDNWSVNHPKSMRFKKQMLIASFISLVLMTDQNNGQQVYTIEMQNQTKQSGDLNLATIYDGVTPESYISYLKLDGTQSSVKSIIQDLDYLNRHQDYTVMLWFKPQSGEAWGRSYQYAFKFENSLQCYFTAQSFLMCDSVGNYDKLIANDVSHGVTLNEWGHITVTGKVNEVSRLLIQTNTNGVVSEDSKPYLPFQQIQRPFSVCLGGCNNEFNFIGGLRDFLVLSRSITKDQALILKNQFFSWDSQVLAYYRFTEGTFLKDYYRMNKVDIVSQHGTSIQNSYGRDYSPNDICSPLYETKLFHEFTQSQEVPSVGIDMRWAPKNTGWEYTVSMWVLIRSDSCSQPIPKDPNNQCYFVSLNDAFIVYQPQPNQVAIFFQNDKIFNQLISRRAFVPHNQWINIQITMNQYKGYQIKVYDVLGKQISSTEEVRDLQPQNIRRKEITIFRGYRGLVKAFTILTERVVLPYNLLSTSQVSVKNSCIAQLHFTEDLLKDLPRITNYCQHSKFGALTFRLAVPGNFVGEQNSKWPNYQINQNTQQANDQYNQSLFDGIACNDGFQSSTFRTRNSYYKTQAKLLPSQNLSAGTVEFWFKTQNTINQTTFLFQVFTNQTQDEFLTIYFEAQFHGALICAPMGRDLIASAFVVYEDYKNLTENQWLHISCSFSQDSVNATLFQQDTISNKEFSYQVSRPNRYIARNDSLIIYIGNSRLLTQGVAGLVVKDVRMWNYQRSQLEIQEWRYNQIDPRSLVSKSGNYPLITYIRFTEANYKEFNFASIIPQSGASALVTFKDIDILSQPGLTLCPLATQFDQERMQCFADPIQKLSLAVYPIVKTSQLGAKSLDWVFDASESQFVNSIVRHQVRFFWDFVDDPIVQQYVQKQNLTSLSKIIIPSSIMRDENFYQVKLNVSNLDFTQSKVKQIKFVPINCQYYVINQQSTTFVNNYTNLRSSEDISFTVDFLTLTSYCGETTFFNQLSPDQFVFDVSPQLKLQPVLRVQSISNTQVRITIPKEEQYKFDTPASLQNRNGFKIIVGVKLTNKVYTANVETKELTFQNVIYNIRFLNDGGQLQVGQVIEETLQPRVKLASGDSIVLRGENAVLDASDTFVSGRSSGSQKEGLKFTWVCPIQMINICQGKNGTQLNISESQFKSSGGKYDTNYTFAVRVEWTKKSGVIETSRALIKINWKNASRPVFDLIMPGNKIFITAEYQDFKLNFKDLYVSQNLDKYTINWVVDPIIESSFLSISPNKTVMTVSKGGFQRLTQYQISIFVKHIEIFQAHHSYNFSFSTSTPPFDGSITLDPEFRSYQTYTIVFKDWSTIAGPIAFRVSSTNGQGQKVSDLSTGWVSFKSPSNVLRMNNQNFTFSPLDYNPLLVELTDYTEEIYSQYINFKTPPTPPTPPPVPPPTPQPVTPPPAPEPTSPPPAPEPAPQENKTQAEATQNSTNQTNTFPLVNVTQVQPVKNVTDSIIPEPPMPPGGHSQDNKTEVQSTQNTTEASNNTVETPVVPPTSTFTPPSPAPPLEQSQLVNTSSSNSTNQTLNSTDGSILKPEEQNPPPSPSELLNETDILKRFSEADPILNFFERQQDEEPQQNEEDEIKSTIAIIKDQILKDQTGILKKNLQLLVSLTSRRDLLTKQAIQDSIEILEIVFSQEDSLIRQSMTNILGNLYQSKEADKQRLDKIKAKLIAYMCQSNQETSINTQTLNITVTNIDVDHSSHIHKSSTPHQYLTLGDSSYLSILPLQISTAMIQNHLKSICLGSSSSTLTTDDFLFEPFSYSQLSLLATDTKHAHVLDQYMQSTVKFVFIINDEAILSKYDTNQTLCMGWETGHWESELCMTEAPKINTQGKVEIQCTCNTMRAESVAVINDYSRMKSGKSEIVKKRLQMIYEENKKNSLVDSNTFKLAIILAIFGVIIISTLIMVTRILDIKDIKKIQSQQMQTDINQELLAKLNDLSGQSWLKRQSELEEFSSTPLKSHLSIILSRSYSLLSIFGSHQSSSSRLDRLSVHLLQVTLYLLLCSLAFTPFSRHSIDPVITDADQTTIILLSLSSLIVLVPIQPGNLLSPLIPLTLSFITLFTSYAVTFLAISVSRITLISILTSVALGLSLGLTISPIGVAMWNLKVKPTRFYRELIDDVGMVRAVIFGSEKEEKAALVKEEESNKETSKIQQTEDIGGMGQTMNNTFAPLQMPAL